MVHSSQNVRGGYGQAITGRGYGYVWPGLQCQIAHRSVQASDDQATSDTGRRLNRSVRKLDANTRRFDLACDC